MKRIKISCFIAGDPEPVLTIECWENEKKTFLDNLNPRFRIVIEYV